MNNEIYVPANQIKELFDLLNSSEIEYVLLRNLDNELPNHLKPTKDIDIIVNPLQKNALTTLLKGAQYQQVRHPWNFGRNFIFLYAMDKFLFFRKGGISLDVCFQLACRSLNAGEWFPLDMVVQDSVFQNRRFVEGEISAYMLSYEDELIHLITRGVFDKKTFNDAYIRRMKFLFGQIDINDFTYKAERVFFKFTPKLVELLKADRFSEIRHGFITYKSY